MNSAMNQLLAHLVGKADLLRIRPEQIEVDIANASAERGGMAERPSGIHLMDFRYTGLFGIERLPSGSLSLLLLLIVCWLADNDRVRCDYGLPWPEVEILDRGGDLVDVLVDVAFIDQLFGSEADGGPLELNGRRYAPDGYVLAVAEHGTVNEAPTETNA